MLKSTCKEKCEKCGNYLIFYGKTKDGRQKYKCRNCKKIFTEDARFTCGRDANKLLALLATIIENDFYKSKDINKILSKATKDKNILKLKNIYFAQMFLGERSHQFSCKNPRLLVCVNDNDIILYKIPDLNKKSYSRDEDIKELTLTHNPNFKIYPENSPHKYILFKNR